MIRYYGLQFGGVRNPPWELRMIFRSLRLCLVFLLSSFTFLALVQAQATSSAAQNAAGTTAAPAYKSTSLLVDQRVQDLLKRMTLEEKATMLSGSGWMESAPIVRLGIPAIKMADGPMGVRSWAGSSAITNASSNPVRVETTSFPSGVAMAATWDTALVQREGQAIAQEVKALGRDMILGPTVNINRVPLWGRNFEGYGEDPYLSGQLGVAYIRGVQGEGVIPSVKHFAANNEEFERHRLDETIDERTLHEIYLPAFKAAVQQADVWTVMSAYEKVNGTYCAENPYLLTDILKKEFGFKGFVVSDWGSTYSTAPTVNAGDGSRNARRTPGKGHAGTPANHHERQQRTLARGRQSASRCKGRQNYRGNNRR